MVLHYSKQTCSSHRRSCHQKQSLASTLVSTLVLLLVMTLSRIESYSAGRRTDACPCKLSQPRTPRQLDLLPPPRHSKHHFGSQKDDGDDDRDRSNCGPSNHRARSWVRSLGKLLASGAARLVLFTRLRLEFTVSQCENINGPQLAPYSVRRIQLNVERARKLIHAHTHTHTHTRTRTRTRTHTHTRTGPDGV